MKKNDLLIKEITYASIAVAILITGGFLIFQLSLVIPIPGVKYILMAPYLSMIIYILLSKINSKFVLLKFGTVFGLIMMLMNIYMGFTIILTSLLTQGSIYGIKPKNRALGGSILFATYTGMTALLISKYLIGGVFLEITTNWLLVTGILCTLFGIIGTLIAKRLMKYFFNYSYN